MTSADKALYLEEVELKGLPGFDALLLRNLDAVTSFVGPNGAGKSTVLRALNLALSLLARGTACDALPKNSDWEQFQSARLRFRSSERRTLTLFSEHVGVDFGTVEIEIQTENRQYLLKTLRFESSAIEFPHMATRQHLGSLEAAIKQTEGRIEDTQRIIREGPAGQKEQSKQQLPTLQHNLEEQRRALKKEKQVIAKVVPSDRDISIDREQIDNFLAQLGLPVPILVPPRKSPEVSIPELISALMKLKKGKKKQMEEYSAVMTRLGRLLQADVDFSEVEGTESLDINGVPFKFASQGTEITLAFFGLTHMGAPRTIILWDEPENGLHPTRRSRLLELMFSDGRQYILATHASEFISLLERPVRVFRCSAAYRTEPLKVSLSLEPVVDRRGAFATVEALGVHPARTLFTANVVIWVEGPTDLLFYRHWLAKRLRARGIMEGFHYAFMQYGGGLISFIEAIDEPKFQSLFDLLSLCRHPAILLDSDLSAAPEADDPATFLKPGALRLLREVTDLNGRRTGSAFLDWTRGREIENYLPAGAIAYAVRGVWKGTSEQHEKLSLESLTFPQFEKIHDTLWDRFESAKVMDPRDADKPAGRSLWGSDNKPEFMRIALEAPGLAESALLWNGAQAIERLEAFVIAHAGED